jgi:hypothetical protein
MAVKLLPRRGRPQLLHIKSIKTIGIAAALLELCKLRMTTWHQEEILSPHLGDSQIWGDTERGEAQWTWLTRNLTSNMEAYQQLARGMIRNRLLAVLQEELAIFSEDLYF